LPPRSFCWYSTESRSIERYGILYFANSRRTDQQNSHHSSANITTGCSRSDTTCATNAAASDSTAGAGASSPAMNYPSRLEVELKALFPRMDITVVNRGIGGETTNEMLARFDRDVFAENPDVVVWQVGSNSVLRDLSLMEANQRLRDGLKRLRAADFDVILMNPQYAPKVINKHDADGMVDLIDLAAKQANVNLFQRFALMRYWRLTEDIPFSTFVSPDELHMNDWSYGCVAKLLAQAMSDAATRSTMTATARPR